MPTSVGCSHVIYWKSDEATGGYLALSIADLSYPRFKYGRTALRTVVCQLRFNPLLKIGQELPIAFQELVRSDFPKFFRSGSAGFRIGGPGTIEALPPTSTGSQFKTEDEEWTAALGVDSLSLETTAYRDFPDFERRFSVIEQAFQTVYRVDHYARVGLRYVNLFDSEQFPGGWLDKFNPQLLGPMADPFLGSDITESIQAFSLADEDWTIAVRHGAEDQHYRLDIDHATEGRVEAGTVTERLRAFNKRIYQVFRWAISDSMHERMDPAPHD